MLTLGERPLSTTTVGVTCRCLVPPSPPDPVPRPAVLHRRLPARNHLLPTGPPTPRPRDRWRSVLASARSHRRTRAVAAHPAAPCNNPVTSRSFWAEISLQCRTGGATWK